MRNFLLLLDTSLFWGVRFLGEGNHTIKDVFRKIYFIGNRNKFLKNILFSHISFVLKGKIGNMNGKNRSLCWREKFEIEGGG